MAHRGALSPRRQGTASSSRVGKSDMDSFADVDYDYERAGAVHSSKWEPSLGSSNALEVQ